MNLVELLLLMVKFLGVIFFNVLIVLRGLRFMFYLMLLVRLMEMDVLIDILLVIERFRLLVVFVDSEFFDLNDMLLELLKDIELLLFLVVL